MNNELYGGYRFEVTPTGVKFIVPYKRRFGGVVGLGIFLVLACGFFFAAPPIVMEYVATEKCGHRGYSIGRCMDEYKWKMRIREEIPLFIAEILGYLTILITLILAVKGVIWAVRKKKRDGHLGKTASIELRPDAIVLDEQHSFRREDIHDLSFDHDRESDTDALKITYGVRDIVLVAHVDPTVARIFKRDFEMAQRRLWHMLD